MGFDVKLKGASWKDKTPKYRQTYTLTSKLSDAIPLLEEVVFYECDSHFVNHSDPRLTQILEELNNFLANYEPEYSGHDLDSMMIVVPKKRFVGTMQDGIKFKGLEPQNDMPVKNAAYQLREVIKYALQRKRDINIF